MMPPAFFFILATVVAAALSSPSHQLRLDEEEQSGALALLQMQATKHNARRFTGGSILAPDNATVAAVDANSSDAGAAVVSPHHGTPRSAIEFPVAGQSSVTTLLAADVPQVFFSWTNFIRNMKQYTITPEFRHALTRSFCVVGVAELFDKTWFVALICALSFGIRNAFFGSFFALLLHTLIAAALGLGISQFLPISVLHFITAGVFAVFTGLFTWEWFAADPDTDALLSRKEEAKEDLGETQAGAKGKNSAFFNVMLWQCFTSVFIAEWGDRTQIAMIALHSSLPVLPVCIGSALAFFALTLSAVLLAALLDGQRLSEKCVCGVSAVSFCVFALLAVMDGVRAREVELAA